MRTDYCKPSLFNKLLMLMQYENALAVMVSLETGLRIDDVLHIKPDDLDGCRLSYVAEKTGKAGHKTLSADLSKRLIKNAGKNWVFEGRTGNKPRTRQAVWKDVKKASELFNLKINVAPHSARKTYAVSKFKEDGIKAVQRELQHDNLATTMLYAFSDKFKNEKPIDGFNEDDIKNWCDYIAERIVEKLRELKKED